MLKRYGLEGAAKMLIAVGLPLIINLVLFYSVDTNNFCYMKGNGKLSFDDLYY